jgi:hypothetical protein
MWTKSTTCIHDFVGTPAEGNASISLIFDGLLKTLVPVAIAHVL